MGQTRSAILAPLNASGNTSLQQQYEYLHPNAPTGKAYYKLTQPDFDGTEQHLGTVMLQRNNTVGSGSLAIPSILPVPTRNEAWLKFSALESENADLSLYNTAGQLIMELQVPTQAGNNQFALQLGHLPSGLYVLMLSNSNSRCVQKLVKNSPRTKVLL